MKLENKVAIVTGASRGIGAAIAVKLAREGAKVVVNYHKNSEKAEEVVKKIKSSGSEAIAIKADVSDFSQVEKMVKQVVDTYGKIDILVNNAGTLRDRTLKNMTKEEWQEVIDVNLTGVFNCTKLALPYIMKSNAGRIIHISSIVGQIGNFGQSNYAASKAGIIGFTRAVARETAKYNVTVNAVSPGFIKTSIVETIPKEIRENILRMVPLGRAGEPEEVANTVIFLASDDSSYITGQVINVNGGLYM